MKALSLFGSLQVLLILCSIIRNKCVALWLGTAGVGVFALYNYTLELINQLAQLNIRESGVRDIAGAHPGKESEMIAVVRKVSVILGLAGTLLTLVLSPLLSRWTFGDYTHTWSFALLSLTVGFSVLTAGEQAVLQASERLRLLARASAVGATVATGVSILLFRLLGMSGIVPSILVFSGVFFAANLYQSRRNVKSPVVRSRDAIVTARPMLRLGLYMTVAMAVTSLSSYIFIAWLRNRAGESGVGLYQSGYVIINQYVGLIFMAMGVEYFPRMSKVARSAARTSVFMAHEMSLLLLLLLPAVLVFVNVAPVIVKVLYSSEFVGIVPYLSIAAVGTVFKASSFAMAFIILARGDGKTYLVTESLSAVLFVVCSIGGYHIGGLRGVAVGYVVWYAIYTASVALVCHKIYRLDRLGRPLLFTIVVVMIAGMQSALCLNGLYIPATGVSLVVVLISAVAVYRLALKRRTLKE